MKLKRARKSRRGRIEIIPMIDIMFFLLASFMLASLTMHHFDALPVNLSQGSATPLDSKDKITLAIDAQNQIYLNEKKINLEDVNYNLQSLLRDGDKTVIIAADKNSLQGVVTETMLKARQAGAERFSIMVKK